MEALRVSKLNETPRWTFDEIMAAYLRATKKGRCHATDLSCIKMLVPYFRGKVVADITISDIDHFIAERRAKGASDKTIHRNLATMSSAINMASKSPEYRGLPNPVKGSFPTIPVYDHRMRWEEKPVIHRIAESMPDPVMRDLVMMAAYSGMRLGEMVGLTWSRVDFGRELIYLRPEDQKDKRHGVVVINQTAKERLLSRKRESAGNYPGSPWVFAKPDGSQLTNDFVRWRWEQGCKANGIEDLRFHDLRHCFCTWLVLAGTDLRRVRDLARHKDMRTTLKYTHLAAEHLRDAAGALDRQDSVSGSSETTEDTSLSA